MAILPQKVDSNTIVDCKIVLCKFLSSNACQDHVDRKSRIYSHPFLGPIYCPESSHLSLPPVTGDLSTSLFPIQALTKQS